MEPPRGCGCTCTCRDTKTHYIHKWEGSIIFIGS
uniref:Uncharacterized protein n=1 Tax=Arundo donax TaxID=35708 RepID=A0A0A9G1H3_ARUDO